MISGLRAKLEAASERPWMGGCSGVPPVFDISVDPGDFGVAEGLSEADAALIVAAVNHLPALLAVCEAAERLANRREVNETWEDTIALRVALAALKNEDA